MATYYTSPTRRTSASTEGSRSYPPRPSVEVDQESVYIFPVPSSIPASPDGSSIFSVPSDFTDSLTESSGRSRHSSISSRFTERSRSRAGSLHRLSSVGEDAEAVFSPVGDGGLDSEVEVWDWTDEASDDLPIEGSSWAFEPDGTRDDSWRHPLVRRPSLSRTQLDALPNVTHQPLLSHRVRKQSNSSTPSATRSSRYTPHPRVRVPLLSFVTSLLSVDLDDSALRLLTHSTSDSVLFPGQSGLLDSHESASSVRDADSPQIVAFHADGTAEDPRPHGLLRLLTEETSSKSVRDGLAVVYDAPLALASPFALPTLSSISNLCRFVGDVWVNGGQAWRELGSSTD
ncbi:hypothetical protein PHLGIDRAFT_128412 [Phlebiopsis gigantea 11061_1 CR5-6]|uniref:Uncharacterized protein n=1 Tax=Phlebiopsis gigantea (strain 11061_1 CR5-6) TaxID=745531 RepID=A0A0C3RWW6_PHLG1|nr:hypothetical protein PHLGIDRAFT_128412 [Phlebiopsis gigantea 11061_1 CR5-6]